MADVNSNININFNTADALAQLRRLQAGLSKFHQSLAEGNLAAANAQKGLNAQLAQAIGATGKFSVSQAKVASSTLAFTTALEKNKLSLKEYYRYSMAAATANTKILSKAFAQEREIINRARRDRVKSLQSQYIQMSKAQGGFIDAMRVMPRTLMMANGRFTELGTRIQYAAQRQQFLNQLLKQGSTQLLNFGKNTQWAGRQLMVGLTIPLMMLGGYASKAFRELEQATLKFRRVYGDAFTNESEVEAAVANIQRLAEEFTKYGVAVKDTVEMAAQAAAAGFQGKALEEQVKTATKLAVLGQVEQQQALETTISLQNAFGLSTDELAEKINFLNAVENQTVLSIEDLTIAIPKAAPVVKQLGGNVEDLAFFLTAMKEGGINASEGANALKSGLASLINPTKKAAAMLNDMGINIQGIVEGNKGDIKATVVGFARALDTLAPLERARAIEQLFGKFQFARLSTLFQNVSKDGTQAARAFSLAGASVEELAILSEREMKKVEESVGVKFQAAVEQFKQDIMPLGKAFLEAVTPIVKFFGGLFEKFNGLSDQTKKVVAVIVGVVAGIGPVLLMTFGLLANGIANLIKLFATIRGGMAKLNGQTNILGAGFDYVTQQQLEQQAASQALHNTHTRLVEVFNIEKTAAMQLASAYGMLSSQMKNMATQNPALFAGGMRGAAGAVSKIPKGPMKFEDGVVSVPGPKGAGDVVPAMVSPGEAIIPAKTAEKHRGLITAMFQDKVPGFSTGKLPANWQSARKFETGDPDIDGTKSTKPSNFDKIVAKGLFSAEDFPNLKSASTSQMNNLIARLEKDIEMTRKVETRKMGLLNENDPNQNKIKNEFIERMKKLDKGNLQSRLLSHIKDNMIYFNGKYYHLKDIQNGAGLANGRTYEEVRDKLLYKSGLRSQLDNAGNQSYTAVKKMTPSSLGDKLKFSEKESGHWEKYIPKDSSLYKSLKSYQKELQAVNQKIESGQIDSNRHPSIKNLQDSADRIKTAMTAAGISPRTITKDIMFDLSHVAKTGEPGKGAAKWSKGTAGFDLHLLNNYMNAGKRASDIVKWNEKNGYPLFSKEEATRYQSAANFMSQKKHPFTPREIAHVMNALQLEERATSLLEKGDPKQTKGLRTALGSLAGNQTQIAKNKILLDELETRNKTGFYDKKNRIPTFGLSTGRGAGQVVGVRAGKEWTIGENGVLQKITKGQTVRKPSNVKTVDPKTGRYTKDNSIMSLSPGQRVANVAQSQARRFMIAGHENAPTIQTQQLSKGAQGRITKALQDQAKLLRSQNKYTEKEIRLALDKLRKKKTEQELNAANARRIAALDRQEIKDRQTKQLSDKDKAKQDKRDAKTMRQEKVGRFSGGASMALGTAGMAAMMAGNQGLGMGLMGASAVAGMAPMLAGMGPIGWAVTAVTTVAGSLYLLDRAAKKAAEAQSTYVDSVTATTEKMAKISEITNTVGASEIMARRRTNTFSDKYTTGFERGKQQFGTSFLESEVGKGMLDTFTKDFAQAGDVAVKRLALELSAYISDGILTAEQAKSIARAIGINMDNMTLAMDINGQIMDLVGPNGENLTTDPLQARVKLVEEGRGLFKDIVKNAFIKGEGYIGDKKLIAQGAAMSVQNLELNQAQLDSLTLYYDKQIESLKKQKEATSDKAKQKQLEEDILQLERQKAEGQSTLIANNKTLIQDQLDLFKAAQESGISERAFFDSLKSQVRTKYKGTAQEAFLDPLLEKTADLGSKELEVKVNTIVAAGQMPPATALKLMETFAGDEETFETTFDVLTKTHDAGAVTELINSLGGLDPEIRKTILVEAAGLEPDQLKEYQSVLNLLNTMDGKEINIAAFIKNNTPKDGTPIEAFEKLNKLLNKVEKFPKKITKTTLLDVQKTDPDMPSMQGLIDTWDKYANLPDEVKKTVVQEYIAIYKTIGAKEREAFAIEKAGGATSGTVYDYWMSQSADKIAAELVPQAVQNAIKSNSGPSTPGSGNGNKKDDPYVELLTRLKNVRNAAINAAGGIKELNRALSDKGLKSVKNKYEGIEQQLNKMGYSRQFSDYLMGLEQKEQNKLFKVTSEKFTKGKNKGRYKDPFTGKAMPKGTKAGQMVLSKEGKTRAKVFDAAIIGDFNAAAGKSLTILNEQEAVRRKLAALGYDQTAIERIISDEYTTQLIYNGKITDQDLKTNAALNNQVVIREKINGLITKGLQAQEQANNVKQIPKVLEFFQKMSKEGITLSTGAMKDLIGDADQLAVAIAAMQDYENDAAGARDRLKEIVDGLNAIKANSNIKLALDFATKNPAEKAQAGFEAAKRVMEVRRTMYSNMTVGEIPGIKTASRTTKDGKVIEGKNIGNQAVANVAARYQAAGVAVPTVAPGQTLKGVQKQRADLAKTMQIGQQALSSLQASYSAKQDALANAQDNLEKALDAANSKYDKLIDDQENIIKGLEAKIKSDYEDKIAKLNKESDKLNNDLAIMDHAADKINEKYDKQAEALQKIADINQQIAESQQQQLGLADALTQGDIAAAARAAQEMRASSSANALDASMQSLEQARNNELGALRGAETGMTRDQISERQFEISQAIYKIETDPERLKIEKQIEEAKAQIAKLEKDRADELEKIKANSEAQIANLTKELELIEKDVKAQEAILSNLEKQDKELESQETYLQSLVDEAVDLDDSTGMTLEKWAETVDKLIDIEKLAEDYAISLAAAEESAALTDASWASILATINEIPESVTTKQIINEIRNITENITRYVNTVNTGGNNTGGYTPPEKVCPNGFTKDSNGNCIQQPCPSGSVRNAQGNCVPINQGGCPEGTREDGNGNCIKINAEADESATLAKLKAEAEAKAAAEKAAAEAEKEKAARRAEIRAQYSYLPTYILNSMFPELAPFASGGLVPGNYSNYKFAKGTDTVPAILTPGEFVMSKYAVNTHGLDTMKAINNGDPIGDSVYNYSISVNVKSDANPDEIARAVMTQIKQVDSKKLRGARL